MDVAFTAPCGPSGLDQSHAFGTRWHRTCCVPLTHTTASSIFASRMRATSLYLALQSIMGAAQVRIRIQSYQPTQGDGPADKIRVQNYRENARW